VVVSDIITQAAGAHRKVVLLKAQGVPVRGMLYGFDMVEYDPSRPEHAVARFTELTLAGKRERDIKLGVAGLVGLGPAAGGAYLLYRMLKK